VELLGQKARVLGSQTLDGILKKELLNVACGFEEVHGGS